MAHTAAAKPKGTDTRSVGVGIGVGAGPGAGALSNAELARLNDTALVAELAETARAKEALSGREAQLGGEIARREAFRVVGATSLESYLCGHLGRSGASARALGHVAARLFDLPALQEALSSGELSFDQVRCVVDVARPESDAEWVARAKGLSVRDLAELVRRARAKKADDGADDGPDGGDGGPDGGDGGDGASDGGDGGGDGSGGPPPRRQGPERPTLRCNDTTRTMTAQLPEADYVELKAILFALAATIGGRDAELGHDERMGLALLSLARRGPTEGHGGAPARVLVAHVGLVALLEHHATLRAELEGAGLISAEVLERLACDATVVVALDDEAGHTIYEGRARRFPSETQRRELWRRDRHCRFPGCGHEIYTNVHHIEPWTPSGRTDLDNLVTLCRHHHHEIHSKRWSMRGDANVELTFVGPNALTMTSRPSPLWGSVVQSE
jgi:hypothetical protein